MTKIASVANLKRRASKIISDLHKDRHPVLIIEHGRSAAYLVDAESFEQSQRRVRILEGIARGEIAIRESRFLTNRRAKAKMKRWLG